MIGLEILDDASCERPYVGAALDLCSADCVYQLLGVSLFMPGNMKPSGPSVFIVKSNMQKITVSISCMLVAAIWVSALLWRLESSRVSLHLAPCLFNNYTQLWSNFTYSGWTQPQRTLEFDTGFCVL